MLARWWSPEIAMPAPIVHVQAVGTCPHGGLLQIISTNTRVLVNAMQAATVADQFMIVGCPFTVPPSKPQPCVRVQWLVPAARVTVNAQPVILQLSTGLCISADSVPAGPPILTTVQPRVIGT
jgi:hypothetical protein